MHNPRSRRIIAGVTLLAVALLIIKGMLLLWDLVALLILGSIASVFGLFAVRSWKYRQSEKGE